jgi:hypothetical protein
MKLLAPVQPRSRRSLTKIEMRQAVAAVCRVRALEQMLPGAWRQGARRDG